MLRSRLFKRFGTGGVDDIPKKGISTSTATPTSPQPEEITNEGGLNIPTAEELNSILQKNIAQPNSDVFGKPFAPKGSYRSSLMPEGTITSEGTTYEPGTFNDASKTLNFLYSNTGTKANEGQAKTQDNQDNQTRDAVSLGLLGLDAGLAYNQDLKNERTLNESIQQRNSKPRSDVNYQYGPTTSGGTEFQPTIKVEMGAQIKKRYASNGANDVEIEGGEFIQLPNFETEMATGPSHSNGGIPTNLPDQTKVYSNNLKPEGSKKTFAQIAKNYDITSYKKTIDNPFAKQVDKDTASIMMQRNQRILDDLFNDQQALNGNSNGEMEAKNGASINNAGFKALPQNVQDKILAEMQYGGYAKREATSLEMADGGIPEGTRSRPNSSSAPLKNMLDYFAQTSSPTLEKELKPRGTMDDPTGDLPSVKAIDPLNLAAMTNLNRLESQYTVDAQGNLPPATANNPNTSDISNIVNPYEKGNFPPKSTYPYDPKKAGMPAYTADETTFLTGMDSRLAPSQEMVPGIQPGSTSGVYGDQGNMATFNKNYDWYLKDLAAKGETYDPKRKGDSYKAQVAFNEEAYNRFRKQGLGEEDARKRVNEIGFDVKTGLQNSLDDKLGKYTATRILPDGTPVTPVTPTGTSRIPPDTTPEKGKSTTPNTEPTKEPTKDPVTGRTFTGVGEPNKGKYIPGEFPLYQAIPEAMGLAQSQEIYPYAIPEIDAPYLRPQTLNIQSQLQDIDSMATASQRAGGDPLTTYIAGLDAKQQAFGAKQNYDANARAAADQANASSQFNADRVNMTAFDQVYNTQIANARDAQSYEKNKQVNSLVNKKAQFTQEENKKSAYINNLIENYDVDSKGNFTLKPGKNPFINNTPSKNVDASTTAIPPTKTKTKGKNGMYKKSKY